MDSKTRHRALEASLKGIVIASAYDGHAMAVVNSYKDALEFGRLQLQDDNAVFVDHWGNVLEGSEVEWHSPGALAPAKMIQVKEGGKRYVVVSKLELRVYTVRLVTFQDVAPPKCGKLKRREGIYVTGAPADSERFEIRRDSGGVSKKNWTVVDTKGEASYKCYSTRDQAIYKVNRILELEHVAARLCEGFKDYN